MDPIEKYLNDLKAYAAAIKLDDKATTAQSIGKDTEAFLKAHKNDLDPRVKDFANTHYMEMFDNVKHKFDETKLEAFKNTVKTQIAIVDEIYEPDQKKVKKAHDAAEVDYTSGLMKAITGSSNPKDIIDSKGKDVSFNADPKKILETPQGQQALEHSVTVTKDSVPDEKKKDKIIKKAGVHNPKDAPEKDGDALYAVNGSQKKVDLSSIDHKELSAAIKGMALLLKGYGNDFDGGEKAITSDEKLKIISKLEAFGVKGLSMQSFQGGRDDYNTPNIDESNNGTFTATINNQTYKIPVTFGQKGGNSR